MTSFIDPLIAFVSDHAWLAYLTIFLAALLEAVPVFGSLVPGSTIIFALSALVPNGDLELVSVFVSAISGALIGDGVAFWIGHRTQRDILNAWPVSRYPAVVARSEAFFQRYGLLAVFFARFVPPIRAFVPLTAGALNMSPWRFYPVNVAAILVWAPAHILPGVLAVSALAHSGAHVKHYWMPTVLVVAAMIGIVTWIVHRRQAIKAAVHPAATARKD